MSSQPAGTPTPQKVVDLATQQATLERLALIGVFGSTSAPGALLRLPGGKFERITPGDEVAGGTVLAIGEDRVVLSRMGSDLVLALPHA